MLSRRVFFARAEHVAAILKILGKGQESGQRCLLGSS
jgi:hypothetical protein